MIMVQCKWKVSLMLKNERLRLKVDCFKKDIKFLLVIKIPKLNGGKVFSNF